MYTDSLEWTSLDDKDGVARAALLQSLGLGDAESILRALDVKGKVAKLAFGDLTLLQLEVTATPSGETFAPLYALAKGSLALPQVTSAGPSPDGSRRISWIALDREQSLGDVARAGPLSVRAETLDAFVRFNLAFFFIAELSLLESVTLERASPGGSPDGAESGPSSGCVVHDGVDEQKRFLVRAALRVGDRRMVANLAVAPDGVIEVVGTAPLDAPAAAQNDSSPQKIGAARTIVDHLLQTSHLNWLPVWSESWPLNRDGHARRAELAELAYYLTRRAELDRSLDPTSLKRFISHLETSPVVRVERYAQAFAPTLDVLRITLVVENREAPIVFFSQRLDRTLPVLWPIGGYVRNLYAYQDACGVIDLSPRTATDYALFLCAFIIGGNPALSETPTAEYLKYPFVPFATYSHLPVELRRIAERGVANGVSRLVREVPLLLDAARKVSSRIGQALTASEKSEWMKAVDQASRLELGSSARSTLRFRSDESTMFLEVSGGESIELRKPDNEAAPPPTSSFVEFEKLSADSRKGVERRLLHELGVSVAELAQAVPAAIHVLETARAEPEAAESLVEIKRTLDHIKHHELVSAAENPGVFGSFRYNRKFDRYEAHLFVQYNSGRLGTDEPVGAGLYVVQLQIPRQSGVPEMRDDFSLGKCAPTPFTYAVPPMESVITDSSRRLRVAREVRRSYRPRVLLDPVGTISAQDAREVLARGEELSDKRVEGDLDSLETLTRVRIIRCVFAGSVVLSGCRVKGDVSLESVEIEGDLEMNDVVVEGTVRLRSVSVGPSSNGSVTTNAGRIRMERAKVERRLLVDHCEVERSIELRGATIGQDLIVSETSVRSVSGENLKVTLGPAVIGPSSSTDGASRTVSSERFGLLCDDGENGTVDFSGAEFGGGLTISASQVSARLLLVQTKVHGSLYIGNELHGRTTLGHVNLSGTHLDANLNVRNTHVVYWFIASDLKAQSITLGARHDVVGATHRYEVSVGRDVEIERSQISGEFRTQGVHIQGTLRIEGSSVGDVAIEGHLVKAHRRQMGASAHLLPTRICDGVEIRGCTVAGSIQFSGAVIDERSSGQYAVDIAGSVIGQHVQFWSARLCETGVGRTIAEVAREQDAYAVIQPEDARSPFEGWPVVWRKRGASGESATPGALLARTGATPPSARSSGAPIAIECADAVSADMSYGELDSHLSARFVFTRIAGDLRISQCRIGCDLRLTNLRAPHRRIGLVGLKVGGNIHADSVGHRYPAPSAEEFRDIVAKYLKVLDTQCARLTLDQSEIEGSVELTGLSATGAPHGAPGDAVVELKNTNVKHALRFVESVSAPPVKPSAATKPCFWSARFGGPLEIQGCSARLLRLGGNHWDRAHSHHVQHPLLRVRGIVLKRMEFVGTLPSARHRRSIDMVDASIDAWEFDDWESPDRKDGEKLGEFLELTKYRGRIYQQVERYLYNSGHDDDSMQVRRDFVWRRSYVRLGQSLPRRLHGVGRSLVGAKRGRWIGHVIGAVLVVLAALFSYELALWRQNQWRLLLLAVPTLALLFAPVRATVRLGATAINSWTSSNFTSWGRVLTCWLGLYALCMAFFLDFDHLDVSAGDTKKNFFSDDKTAAEVCSTFARWDWRHSLLLSTRFMIPIAPSTYQDIDIGNSFDDPTPAAQSAKAQESKSVADESKRSPSDQLVTRCSQVVPGWSQGAEEFPVLHTWNPTVVATLVRILANALLTLFAATILAEMSRAPRGD